MTLVNQPTLPDLDQHRRARMTPPSEVGGAERPSSDRDAAERLISDLVALVDAGLVTVRRQLGGPARYGVVRDFGGDAA